MLVFSNLGVFISWKQRAVRLALRESLLDEEVSPKQAETAQQEKENRSRVSERVVPLEQEQNRTRQEVGQKVSSLT